MVVRAREVMFVGATSSLPPSLPLSLSLTSVPVKAVHRVVVRRGRVVVGAIGGRCAVAVAVAVGVVVAVRVDGS